MIVCLFWQSFAIAFRLRVFVFFAEGRPSVFRPPFGYGRKRGYQQTNGGLWRQDGEVIPLYDNFLFFLRTEERGAINKEGHSCVLQLPFCLQTGWRGFTNHAGFAAAKGDIPL